MTGCLFYIVVSAFDSIMTHNLNGTALLLCGWISSSVCTSLPNVVTLNVDNSFTGHVTANVYLEWLLDCPVFRCAP